MEDIQKIREIIESKMNCFNDGEYLQLMNLLKSVYEKLPKIEEEKNARALFQSPPPPSRRMSASIWTYVPRAELVNHFFENYPRTLVMEELVISREAPDSNVSSNILFLISSLHEAADDQKVRVIFSTFSYIFSHLGFMRRNRNWLLPIFQMLRREFEAREDTFRQQGLGEHIERWLETAQVCFQL